MKIGFFDTGLGGATIFKCAYHQIPAEYIYLADTKNSPYGIKDRAQVQELTENCMKILIEKGCKIIVIACNTATSAAISYLRKKYPDIIFIGAEPAIKPALKNSNNKKIILTATSLTLKGAKLFDLLTKLNGVDKVTLLPLDELVEFADCTDKIQYEQATDYLKNKFNKLDLAEYSGIVLGCTHFPIFKDQIRKLLPEEISIYDSAEGITNNLMSKLSNVGYFSGVDFSTTINCPTNAISSVELIQTEESDEFKSKFFEFIDA